MCIRDRGKAPQEMHPGDVLNIPPEVKHWHGAAPDCWFSHLAVEVPGEGTSNAVSYTHLILGDGIPRRRSDQAGNPAEL